VPVSSLSKTPDAASLRRLVLMVGAVVLLDTAFFAVVAPLLPTFSHQFHLTKLGAGILEASYPAGMLLASIPGGMLSVRLGPRRTVVIGLVMLACTTIAFGFAASAAELDVARAVEGAAGACSWAGGVTWLVAASPPDRRGATMGAAIGAAVFGAMAGPALGVAAAAIGRSLLFSILGLVALALAITTTTLPDIRATPAPQALRPLSAMVRKRSAWSALWLMGLPAIISGMLAVLGSLRLHHLGATTAEIGAVFLMSAGLEAITAPQGGRLSDRRGRLAPMRIGLGLAAVTLACFTLVGAGVLLAALIVVASLALGAFWAPAMALLSDLAEAGGVDQGLAAALMNLAWAAGQLVGAGVGGALAKATGDGVPTLTGAGLCLLTLLLAGRPMRGRAVAGVTL
jgi:MFS family permease